MQQAKARQLQSIQKQDLELGLLWEQVCSQEVKGKGQDLVIEQGLLCAKTEDGLFWIVPWNMRKDLLLWVHGSSVGARLKQPEAKDRLAKMGWWP